MAKNTQQSVLFPTLFKKPITLAFDTPSITSDGGGLLLGALDRGIHLTEQLAASLNDPRDPSKTQHTCLELFRQRVYSIALGYADCNDSARIGEDPVLKELCDRQAVNGAPLASQPTLSRFENAPAARELIAMGRALENFVINRHRKRRGRKVRHITIDVDPSEDPTHGQQAFSFFNGHYDSWCYLPTFGFLTFDHEPEQYLFFARLRPGNSSASRCTIPMLRRVVPRLRKVFPKAQIYVRLDGGFATPRVFACLEELRVKYVVAMASNSRLLALAEPWISEASARSALTGKAEQVFGEFQYAARSWPHERRVIVKAEVVHLQGREPRKNPRFIITNLRRPPENVYCFYRRRGEVENRIKELHYGLEVDRTSCSRFLANQFRVLMTSSAYVFFQELRLRAQRSELGRAQVSTLRERLLKLGARVVETVRRVVFHLPSDYPWLGIWKRIAKTAGAVFT
jgi:hypothetical protein